MESPKTILPEVKRSIVDLALSISHLVPVLDVISKIIVEIIQINEKAQFNKKISKSIIDRVISAEAAVKFLQSRRAEYEEKFRDLKYQESLHRLKSSLEKIKKFVEDVTQLRGIEKYISALNIEKKFIQLTEEYEVCMRDLKFTMVVAFDEQRRIDNEGLKLDLAETTKFVKEFTAEHKQQLNILYQEINSIKTQLETTKDLIQAQKIEPNLLRDPPHGLLTDRRGKSKHIFKKVYRDGIEVACKPFTITQNGERDFHGILSILGKLNESQNILKFYGLSVADNKEVMIFEWAEMGNLKDVYNNGRISWGSKAQIAFSICKGIAFLNSAGVYHHDIRCENVMITSNQEAKLANFHFARLKTEKTSNITRHILDIINWMAPEKMYKQLKEGLYIPYTQKCEIFGFGMLLWELTYQKIPYKDMEFENIIKHVTNGNRESFSEILELEYQTDKTIQKSFIKIIKASWKEHPEERIGISKLYLKLSKLVSMVQLGKLPFLVSEKHSCTHDSLPLLKTTDVQENTKLNTEIDKILMVDEGIRLHKSNFPEKRIQAWNCFSANAKLGNPDAMYWKGYYLWEGLYPNATGRSETQEDNDRKEARELFKKAADEGIADAQFRYALSIKENRKEVMHYLNKAADNGNIAAIYSLGDIYFHGKADMEMDKQNGLRYLKLAAMKGHVKAIAVMQEMNVNIYDSN